MTVVYKPTPVDEEAGKGVFYLAMHTSGIVIPFPKGNKPSLSLLTRYGTAFVNKKALGSITIS
jgi:hypothetical protein